MKHQRLVAFIVILFPSLLVCTLAAAQSRTLVTTRTVELPAGVAGKVSISSRHDVRCDPAGDMLFQLHSDDDSLTPDSLIPFVKISPTGELIAKITLGTLPDFREPVIEDFSLSPDGKIYFMVGKVNESDDWLLSFGANGGFVSETRLRVPGLSTVAFAPFTSGNILVVGFRGPGNVPFAGIFSLTGDLVRDITLPADLSRSDVDLVTRQVVSAQAASDGNFYVLTGFLFPQVTVFTPSGDVKQTTRLPIREDQAVVTGQFSDGKIAVRLASRHDSAVVVFNAFTGELLEQYQPSQPYSADLVCYSGDVFTFLKNEGTVLHLARPSTR